MTLITEMMQRPLDPGYAAAAQTRQQAGLPPATGVHSPLLVIAAVLIGALLATSALALRTPTTAVSEVKLRLVERIEAARAQADTQTRLIARLRNEINAAQAVVLSRQSQTGLAAELSRLELAAGTVPVTGPGLVLTVDDALTKADLNNPDADPRTKAGQDDGKIFAKDLQEIVNGLWQAGAEAISINGHRLTARAAIRFAGAAIVVDYRPLTRPYTITAIGDPGALSVEFTDNTGGRYLHSLTTNFKVRSSMANLSSVVIPGEPSLSLQNAQPLLPAATTKPSAGTRPTSEGTKTTTGSSTTGSSTTGSSTTGSSTTGSSTTGSGTTGSTARTKAPQPTETSP